jgi:putative ABC transport system permease protein
MIERLNEIIATLKKNKLRSFLTAFGVFWGIFMLIIMAGAGKGLESGITQGVGQIATNSFFMWTQRTGEPYEGFRRGRRWDFDNGDVEYIRQHVPEVAIVAPRLFGSWLDANNTIRGDRAGSFNIKGDYPDWEKVNPGEFPKGRWINEIDIQQRRKVCVIGEKVYDEMFEKGEEPVGEYLKIGGIFYQVIGVIHPVSNMNMNGSADESIFLPFTTMQVAYNYGNSVHMMGIVTVKGQSASVVEDKVLEIIKRRHKIAPNDVQAIGHVNLEKQFKQFAMLFGGINILTWIVGIGTLLAGVIGVSNIMLVIVKERTQEIGIMRAIGATPAKIISQIIAESVFLTTIAGYIGLVCGILLLELINLILGKAAESGSDIFIKNPEVNMTVAIACLLILIISGAIAGYIPAKRAIQIKPIDALRTEN